MALSEKQPPRVMESRFKGCLLAGAVGDALGAPVEFQRAASIFKAYGLRGITELPRPGVFTDDTQMTLFTAEGLISAVGQGLIQMPSAGDPPKVSDDAISMLHQSYLRWLHTQQTESRHNLFPQVKSLGWLTTHKELHRREAPGMTCLGALASGGVGRKSVALNDSKGCGGVMRVATAALIVQSAWPEESAERKAALAYEIGCCASAITHLHVAGYQSGGMLAAIISYVLSGRELLQAVELARAFLAVEEDHAETLACVDLAVKLGCERKAFFGDASNRTAAKEGWILEDVKSIGGGWIGEEALGIAIYCCIVAGSDLESGIIWSVNHSGDSDSTGAIAGNILGALLGEESIRKRWVDGLEMHNLVSEVAEDLSRSSQAWAAQQVQTAKYPPLLKPQLW